MYAINRNKTVISYLMVLGVLIYLFSLQGSTGILAQSGTAFVGEVRALELEQTGIVNPAGLAFSPSGKAFHVVAAGSPGQPPPANTDLIKLTAFGDKAGSAKIAAAVKDPVNMAFDSTFNRLLIFQSPNNHLIEVLEDSNGNLDPTTLVHHDARHFELQNPQGMTVDPASGDLFILDVVGPRLVRVEPEPDGSFDAAVISDVALQPAGLTDGRGIALDPTTGHLHLLSPGDQLLYELTQTGQVVATRDVSEFGFRDPQGMGFAPSGDLTDDPSRINLYIADTGLLDAPQNQSENGQSTSQVSAAAQAPGEIAELTFTEPTAPAAATAEGTLIQTVDTSQFNPPSPDPSGIAYLPNSGTLLIADGEVNEMPIFTGDNLFESSLSGSLVDTLTTVSYSDEPVGIDINPANRHLFISDDTGTRSIYEVNPGGDGLYNTSDDSVTSFATSAYGNSDPEGVTYDTSTGALFIIDGVNREVYRVAPGANGIFDGVDDQVSHFDTLSFGLDDPEGIVYNPLNGHLYAIGKPAGTLFELTTGGAVVRTIDVTAADMKKPAGLALAPGSQNPGEMNIYIAARGVDNDSDPNENDGKVYEIALGLSVATPTNTPAATAVPPTPTATGTATTGPSPTPTNTPTATAVPPTSTPTNTPTMTPTPTNTPVTTGLTLPAVADARVLQSNPDTNYGTITRLDVDSPGEESYIRFSVSGVTGAVQSATLRLFVTNGSTNGPSLYGTDNSWTEAGITWNNRPAPTTGVIANLGSVAANAWAEYNVTAHITGNGTYSFVLLPDSSNGVTFESREGSPPPELVLSFATGPTPTATNTPVNSPTPTNTPVPSSTPTATATPVPATSTATSTPTPGPSSTPTNTPTATSAPPTPTNTPTPTGTAMATSTPTATHTPAVTPTPTNTPGTSGLTLAAVADAEVLAANPATNFGTTSNLHVDMPGEESYIRFSVSGVTGAVQSATLRLFATNGSSDGPGVYGTTNTWTETGITWNNRPAPTTGVIANIGTTPSNAWAEYNVTAYVTGDGTYSFVLLSDNRNGVTFTSREGNPAPQLVLSFGSGPTSTPTNTPPTGTMMATSTSTATLVPPTPTTTSTPTPGPSSTPTNTPTSVSATATPTNTPTPTGTVMATSTPTATHTPAVTPTPTNTPGTSGLTLAAVADAQVVQANPSTNYGTSSRLNVDSPGEESYIRFSVSGVTGAVQSATLRLFATNGSSDGPGLFGTDNSWTEAGITWNNRPAPTTGVIDNVGAVSSNAWTEYNVTAHVTGNGTYSFVLLPDSSDGVRFESREGNPPPELVLAFTTGPTPTATPVPPTATATNTPTPGPSPTPTSTPSTGSAVFVGAGDIADCSRVEDEATALLLDTIPGTVFTVGDNAYPNGSASSFNNCYDPTWGRHKARTRPAVGDGEYGTSGATGYFNYFGTAAGNPGEGYYSYDVGSWHIVVLNSNCSEIGGCNSSSPQGQWLQADLDANPSTCILAIFHEPLFSSSGVDEDMREFWVPLYDAGADIILNGHRHNYERFAQQNPDGVAEPGRGIREFVVGTGGASLSSFDTNAPNSEIRNNTTHGVLKLTLNLTSYDWQFIPITGQTFTDSGSTSCVVVSG